jgi:hypothetical protein
MWASVQRRLRRSRKVYLSCLLSPMDVGEGIRGWESEGEWQGETSSA